MNKKNCKNKINAINHNISQNIITLQCSPTCHQIEYHFSSCIYFNNHNFYYRRLYFTNQRFSLHLKGNMLFHIGVYHIILSNFTNHLPAAAATMSWLHQTWIKSSVSLSLSSSLLLTASFGLMGAFAHWLASTAQLYMKSDSFKNYCIKFVYPIEYTLAPFHFHHVQTLEISIIASVFAWKIKTNKFRCVLHVYILIKRSVEPFFSANRLRPLNFMITPSYSRRKFPYRRYQSHLCSLVLFFKENASNYVIHIA